MANTLGSGYRQLLGSQWRVRESLVHEISQVTLCALALMRGNGRCGNVLIKKVSVHI